MPLLRPYAFAGSPACSFRWTTTTRRGNCGRISCLSYLPRCNGSFRRVGCLLLVTPVVPTVHSRARRIIAGQGRGVEGAKVVRHMSTAPT